MLDHIVTTYTQRQQVHFEITQAITMCSQVTLLLVIVKIIQRNIFFQQESSMLVNTYDIHVYNVGVGIFLLFLNTLI